MKYQVFTEFDAYEDAIQHARVRMILHRRERPRWAVGQMSVGPLHLQWGTSGGGMVSEGEILPGGYALFVPLNNCSTNGVNGLRLSAGSIMVAASGSEFCISADGWNDWCSVFIPLGDIPDEAQSVDELPSRGCRVVHLGSRRLRIFRRAVRELVGTGPSCDLVRQVKLDADKNILLQFARSAVAQGEADNRRGRGRPMVDRRSVIQMAEIDDPPNFDRKRFPRDLADAAQVSERTLHRVFREWFGVSPNRYARLRLLHCVRDALLAADPRSTTVTAVLLQHGIEQFGRFSGQYHSLFGESPSQTLRRR